MSLIRKFLQGSLVAGTVFCGSAKALPLTVVSHDIFGNGLSVGARTYDGLGLFGQAGRSWIGRGFSLVTEDLEPNTYQRWDANDVAFDSRASFGFELTMNAVSFQSTVLDVAENSGHISNRMSAGLSGPGANDSIAIHRSGVDFYGFDVTISQLGFSSGDGIFGGPGNPFLGSPLDITKAIGFNYSAPDYFRVDIMIAGRGTYTQVSSWYINGEPVAVPEPSSVALLLMGLAALPFARRKRLVV